MSSFMAGNYSTEEMENWTTQFSPTTLYPYSESWSRFHWYVFIWLFPSLCFVGGVMNLLCFWVILRHRRLFPRVTRQFMLIISLNDAIILLLKAPTHYLTYMSQPFVDNGWTWFSNPFYNSYAGCIFYMFVSHYALFGAPFFQLGLTVDRLVAVASPLRARRIMTATRSVVLLAAVTALALVLPVLRTATTSWNSDTLACTVDSRPDFDSTYVKLELFYGRVALTVCLISGSLVICVLLRRSNIAAADIAGQVQAGRADAIRRFRTLTRLSLLLALFNVAFLLCNLPWSLAEMLRQTGALSHLSMSSYELLIRQLNTLMYFQCVLNVLVYFSGSSFRQKFSATFSRVCGRFCCCCPEQSSANVDGNVFSLSGTVNQPAAAGRYQRNRDSGFRNVRDSTKYH